MNLFDAENKTELTKNVTAATISWMDLHGFKPLETEVYCERGWVADIAGAIAPTETELQELKLIRRKPAWKSQEQVDAWYAEAKAFPPMFTAIIEVKTSRADFLGDKKWKIVPPADLAYIAAPTKLISKDELPEGWGLLEYNESRDCMVTRHVPDIQRTTDEQQKILIYNVALRRDSLTRYQHLRSIQKRYREEDNHHKSLLRMKTALRVAHAIVFGEHESIEAALDYCGMKDKNVLAEVQILGWGKLLGIARGRG